MRRVRRARRFDRGVHGKLRKTDVDRFDRNARIADAAQGSAARDVALTTRNLGAYLGLDRIMFDLNCSGAAS